MIAVFSIDFSLQPASSGEETSSESLAFSCCRRRRKWMSPDRRWLPIVKIETRRTRMCAEFVETLGTLITLSITPVLVVAVSSSSTKIASFGGLTVVKLAIVRYTSICPNSACARACAVFIVYPFESGDFGV